MIVEYPGPDVVGQARTEAQYVAFFGLYLKPGLNEVGLSVGRQLVAAGLVVEATPPAPTPQPESAPVAPEAFETPETPEPDPQPSPKSRNRR